MQYVELDLHEFRGLVPEELFGHSHFPPIGETTYLLTLGPHGFYWFSLVQPQPGERGDPGFPELGELGTIEVPPRWEHWLFHEEPDRLEAFLPKLVRQRQPGGVSQIVSTEIQHEFTLSHRDVTVHWLLIRVEYRTKPGETILLPVTFLPDDAVSSLLEPVSWVGLVHLTGARTGVLCDALAVPACGHALLDAIRSGKTHLLADGDLAAVSYSRLADDNDADLSTLPVSLVRSRRFNSSLVFDSRYSLKVYRRIEEGVNPDLEISAFLSSRQHFESVAPLLGSLEYRRRNAPPITLAVLHQYVVNQGTAWRLTLDQLSLFFERVAAHWPAQPHDSPIEGTPLPADGGAVVDDLIGSYLHHARQLGQRTARMHIALASDKSLPAFAPEPFGRAYQRSIYQSMRNLTNQVCVRLARQRAQFPQGVQELADKVLGRQDVLLKRFRKAVDQPIGGQRIRCHGDYHLGQLLFTGNDFVVIDFEGDPEQTIGKRRLKHSPLRDVATLIRSFDYAVHTVLYGLADSRGRAPGVIRAEDLSTLEPWGRLWCDRVAREFLAVYYAETGSTNLLPASASERHAIMDVFLLEAALDEIARVMAYYPDWLFVPFKSLLRMFGDDAGGPTD